MIKLVLILIITFAFIRCNKANNSPVNSVDFIGKWKMVSQTGGISGHNIQIPKDSIFTLTLNKDKTYQNIRNNKLQSKGRYSLKTINNDYLITFDGGNLSQNIGTRNDSLFLSDTFPDGYGTLYSKVKR